jgi:predicted transposase YdaD
VTILLRYLWLVAEVDPAEAAEIVTRAHPQAEELIMTIAEQLREQGRQEGRQQGRQEGRQEGQRLTLLKQLRLRFQGLPDEVIARLEAASTQQLDRWAERILTAETLDQVFAD